MSGESVSVGVSADKSERSLRDQGPFAQSLWPLGTDTGPVAISSLSIMPAWEHPQSRVAHAAEES